MHKLSNTIFHAINTVDVVSLLNADLDKGLSENEVLARLNKYGENSISGTKQRSAFFIFLGQFQSPIVYLLLFAALLSLWFEEYPEAMAILVVIFINTIIGFLMEHQAEISMQSLKKLSNLTSKVIRGGHLTEIDSDRLVPGDIVFVEPGDLVSADGRIFSSINLHVDESALTGESFPVEKQTSALPEGTILPERTNMLFKGTYVNKGNGYFIATGTGMQTELGKIACLVQVSNRSITPLENKIKEFSKWLIWLTLGLVTLIFIAGLINGHELNKMLKTAIALAVATIPEGLQIVTTIALAQGMLKMARSNVIIKKLSAVETLGGTNVLCVDKTGTLTKNKIEVNEIYPTSDESIPILKDIAIHCCNAEIHYSGNKIVEIGDPLELALLKYFNKEINEKRAVIKKAPKISEEPFSSETKIMATKHKIGSGFIVYAKGAAEEILHRSNYIQQGSQYIPLNEEVRQNWLDKSEQLSASGMRIIALAYKKNSFHSSQLTSDLVFCGLVGMLDPPREDVFEAIKQCHSAGINIIMITGDHPSTAKTIAEKLNIINQKNSFVILGQEMKDFDVLPQVEKDKWSACNVFARVSPKQKLDLVKVLQEKKFIVGMTGDGINDTPAMKEADIGIAMGQRGAQVAMEVADMVIKDDSFNSIVLAIMQGRIIFENIRKFVVFLLSCNLSELFVISIASVFNLPFQLFALQILFINLITDVLPALALGITDGSPFIMTTPPREKSEPIVDKKLWGTILFYAGVISGVTISAVLISHFYIHNDEPLSPKLSNNIVFFTLIGSQLLHVLNMSKSGTSFYNSEVFKNQYIWYSIIASIGILIAINLNDTVKGVLSIYAMTFNDWMTCILASFVSLVIIQIAKKTKLVKQ